MGHNFKSGDLVIFKNIDNGCSVKALYLDEYEKEYRVIAKAEANNLTYGTYYSGFDIFLLNKQEYSIEPIEKK